MTTVTSASPPASERVPTARVTPVATSEVVRAFAVVYTNLVRAPVIGIRRGSTKLVGDMLVRPYDYRGRR